MCGMHAAGSEWLNLLLPFVQLADTKGARVMCALTFREKADRNLEQTKPYSTAEANWGIATILPHNARRNTFVYANYSQREDTWLLHNINICMNIFLMSSLNNYKNA